MSRRERENEIEWEKKEEKIEIIQTLPVYKAKIVKIKIESVTNTNCTMYRTEWMLDTIVNKLNMYKTCDMFFK